MQLKRWKIVIRFFFLVYLFCPATSCELLPAISKLYKGKNSGQPTCQHPVLRWGISNYFSRLSFSWLQARSNSLAIRLVFKDWGGERGWVSGKRRDLFLQRNCLSASWSSSCAAARTCVYCEGGKRGWCLLAQDGRSWKSASPCPEGHPHFWDHGCSRVSCYLVQVRIAADPNLWKALLLLQWILCEICFGLDQIYKGNGFLLQSFILFPMQQMLCSY